MSPAVTLRLAPRLLDAVRRHAEEAYPRECCGFLIGFDHEGEREIVSVTPADNAETGSPTGRYLVAPEHYFKAECDAARRGLAVTGFYHSHPGAEPVPSEADRAGALPGVSYLIVSVIQGRAAGVRSWALDAGSRRFAPEPLDG